MRDSVLQFWGSLKQRKKLWLLPMIVVVLLLTLLLVLTSGAGAAPFIYRLF
jgi:Family of unknown function (DUF5989)